MRTSKKTKNFSILAGLLFLLLAVSTTGSFAVSIEQRKKVEISSQIKTCEAAIIDLRRQNENLNVKIAEQENPRCLSVRAGSRLIQPKMAGVVWAYENFDGGRVEFTNKSKGLVSFKAPERKNKAR